MDCFWDISLPIHPAMLTWPGDPPVTVTPALRVAHGDGVNVSAVTLGSHTGTHIDPPSHCFDGAPTVDALAPGTLIGEAIVVEIPRLSSAVSGCIEPADLREAGIEGAARVLFKTGNSQLWSRPEARFPEGFVSISPDAATWLVEQQVRLVGIDFLSVDALDAPGLPAHWTFLASGVVILEGLDLSAVPPGRYDLVCLPLRLAGGDGGPARAFLIDSRRSLVPSRR